MKNNDSLKPDAVYTQPPKTNIFGQKRLDSGQKVYPSNNVVDKALNAIRNTGVRRSNNSWLGGVCGMVAEKTGWNVNIIRGVTVGLTVLMAGAPLMVYGLAWGLLSDEEGTIHAQELKHENISVGAIGASLMFIFAFFSLFWGKIVTAAIWVALIGAGYFAVKYWAKKGKKGSGSISRMK